jgi:hypothetical protein
MSKITFQPMVIPTGPKTPTMASHSLFAPEDVNGTGSASSSYNSKRSGIYRGASVEVSPFASSIIHRLVSLHLYFAHNQVVFGFFIDMNAACPIVHDR